MTRAEALAEARRRWECGLDRGDAWRKSITSPGVFDRKIIGWRYFVGAVVSPPWATVPYRSAKGEGPSWEAAFADADRRERGSK